MLRLRSTAIRAAFALIPLIALIISCPFGAEARADERRASLVSVPSAKKKIKGLQWTNLTAEVLSERLNYDIVAGSYFEGSFRRPGWNLVVNQTKIALSSDGRFRIRVPLSKKQTLIHLIAIGPQGETEEEAVTIQFPSFDLWIADQKDPMKKRHSVVSSIGLSYISYTESLSEPLNQTAITLKLGYVYFLKPPRWDLGLSGYFTAVPMTSSRSGISARFLGLNARLGYVLPFVSEPWRISVMGGLYYTTLISSNGEFGFQNLMGPQFFPVVRRMFGNGDTLTGYFKFSPVGNGFSLSEMGNREIATGLSWSHRLKGFNAIAVGLDLADLTLLIEGVSIQSKSVSLGVGYAW